MFNKKKSQKEYEYCIENVTTKDTFDAQCRMLQQNLLDLQKDDLVVSDDGSLMQFYIYRGMEISVLYDTDLQEIYVKSPIDIEDYILNT
ncbi:MAG: hypothetical protein AB1Z23_02050 [Eubacteriales bacterium]